MWILFSKCAWSQLRATHNKCHGCHVTIFRLRDGKQGCWPGCLHKGLCTGPWWRCVPGRETVILKRQTSAHKQRGREQGLLGPCLSAAPLINCSCFSKFSTLWISFTYGNSCCALQFLQRKWPHSEVTRTRCVCRTGGLTHSCKFISLDFIRKLLSTAEQVSPTQI